MALHRVPFVPADAGEEDGLSGLASRHRFIGQGDADGVDGCAADEGGAKVELDVLLVAGSLGG